VFHLHFHVIPRYGPGNPFLEHGRVKIEAPEAAEISRKLGPG
jgi:diadenosine tetraphosphate (Ap4A) HIT family hydrolase